MVAFGSLWLMAGFESHTHTHACVCGCYNSYCFIFIQVVCKARDNMAHITSSPPRLPLSFLPLSFSLRPLLSLRLPLLILCLLQPLSARAGSTHVQNEALFISAGRQQALSPGCLLGPTCLASWFSTYVSHT